MSWSIGIDAGGTFTDVVAVNAHGDSFAAKIPSTPDDPARAFGAALDHAIAAWQIDPAFVASVAHGTTVATNAILERRGAPVGLITTAGFDDVLELGRQSRRDLYQLAIRPQTPVFIAPRERRIGVAERIDQHGVVITALDEQATVAAAATLIERGATALAISFLWGFKNPVHEQRARQLIQARWASVPISIASDVDPTIREAERTIATAFDAYLKGPMDRYLRELSVHCTQRGIRAPLSIIRSDGELASADAARGAPVRLSVSGPAAAVRGAINAAAVHGVTDFLLIDVGGTSADCAMITAGSVPLRDEGDVAGFAVQSRGATTRARCASGRARLVPCLAPPVMVATGMKPPSPMPWWC